MKRGRRTTESDNDYLRWLAACFERLSQSPMGPIIGTPKKQSAVATRLLRIAVNLEGGCSYQCNQCHVITQAGTDRPLPIGWVRRDGEVICQQCVGDQDET